MRVLIFGGTGAMGIHLVRLLSDSGIETVVTSRKQRSPDDNIRYIQGNAHEIDFIQTLLSERWDAIVDFMVYTTVEFQNRVTLLLGATNQYVFISSSRIYADSITPVTEASSRLLDVSQDQEFLSTDEYSLTKARQENILRESGLNNWTIIRPYITYSENRLQLGVLEKEEWLYRALQGKSIVFSSDIGERKTTMMYGLDVSKAIASLIGNKKTLGEAFHITTPESYTWNDILSIYLNSIERFTGNRPKVLLLSLDSFMAIRGGRYQIIYDRLFNRQFNNSKIGQFVNTETFTKMESGLDFCLEEFLKNPHFKHISGRAEARKDRLAKERTSLGAFSSIKQKIAYILYRYVITK